MLANSSKFSDITKREIFQHYFPERVMMYTEKVLMYTSEIEQKYENKIFVH